MKILLHIFQFFRSFEVWARWLTVVSVLCLEYLLKPFKKVNMSKGFKCWVSSYHLQNSEGAGFGQTITVKHFTWKQQHIDKLMKPGMLAIVLPGYHARRTTFNVTNTDSHMVVAIYGCP